MEMDSGTSEINGGGADHEASDHNEKGGGCQLARYCPHVTEMRQHLVQSFLAASWPAAQHFD
jgi:hypothetical protein